MAIDWGVKIPKRPEPPKSFKDFFIAELKKEIKRGDTPILMEIYKRQRLNALVRDAMPKIWRFILRVDLDDKAAHKFITIWFRSGIGAKEYKYKRDEYIQNMRELYKKRKLRNILVFHQIYVKIKTGSFPAG